MQIKSNHKKISDLQKSLEYPLVELGYLDTRKQSNKTDILEEIYDPNESLKWPLVERGYLDITKQSYRL